MSLSRPDLSADYPGDQSHLHGWERNGLPLPAAGRWTCIALVDKALGLQMISIRLPVRLIEQLKVIAMHRGIGYQPLMRDVLGRFARGELIQVLRLQTEIAKLEGRKAVVAKPKASRLRRAA